MGERGWRYWILIVVCKVVCGGHGMDGMKVWCGVGMCVVKWRGDGSRTYMVC